MVLLQLLRVLCLSAMDAKPGTRKKLRKFAPLAPLLVAIPPFLNSLDNPHLKGLRGPDILQLLAIGMCIGAALALFFAGLHDGRGSS